MKKLIQFTALFAVVCSLFVGCGTEKGTEENKMSITLSGESSIIAGSEALITIRASSTLDEPLVVKLASDNAAVTVPESVTIEAGKDVATATIRGISAGTAKITITAEGVSYITREISVTVTEKTADTPELSIEAEATEIATGAVIPFTITSSIAPKSDLTISLAANNAGIVAFPASVVISAGETTFEGELTAKAVGETKITMSAAGTVIKNALTIKVAEAAKFAKLYATGVLNPPTTPFANLVCESNVYGKVYPGSLFYHDYDKLGGTPTGIYKSTIDYYGGDAVGTLVNGEVFFTSIPEGTVIDSKLPWQLYKSTYMRFPIVVKNGDAINSIADGTHFIVLALPREGDPNHTGWDKAVNMPCWLKIKVEGMKVEVLDGIMCLDKTMEFKVGQK